MTRKLTAAIVLLATLLGVPRPAAAQVPVRTFDQLNTRLKVGDTVWVTYAQGREIKGKIRELTPSALTIDGGGLATLQAEGVRLVAIRKGKPVVRTMLIGFGIGAGVGALAGALSADSDTAEATSGGVLWGGLIGAGACAAIGATRRGKVVEVYRVPGSSSSARLSLAPVITPRTKGVAVSYTF